MSQQFNFSDEERSHLERELQTYLQAELDLEIGRFDAGFLLDFIGRKIAPAFYNRGVYDAQTLLETRLEQIREDILGLEKYPD